MFLKLINQTISFSLVIYSKLAVLLIDCDEVVFLYKYFKIKVFFLKREKKKYSSHSK